jgi:hypothetical protein
MIILFPAMPALPIVRRALVQVSPFLKRIESPGWNCDIEETTFETLAHAAASERPLAESEPPFFTW